MKNTQGKTLCPFVEQFTQPEATLYTDEYDSYNQLSAFASPSVTAPVNGLVTMMAMAFGKSIATPMKAVGRACAISYVPSVGFIRNTCLVTSPFMSFLSIRSWFLPLSSLLLFVCTSSEHEPQDFEVVEVELEAELWFLQLSILGQAYCFEKDSR